MNTESRFLALMRHAKAEATGASDAQRELTARGVVEAQEAGRWLAEQCDPPDHALVSGATRTRQTWDAVARGAAWTTEADLSDAFYAAGPDSALDLIREVPLDTRTLIVIGHNPTVAYLAQLLSDGTADPEIAREMAHGYPPATVTVFEVDRPWSELELASARVVGFRVGHG